MTTRAAPRRRIPRLAAAALVASVLAPPVESALDCANWSAWKAFEIATLAEATACLDAGADPNALDELGETPLYRAAESGPDPAIVRALLDAGADPNARTRYDWTVLHAGASGGGSEIVRLLLAAGADPHPRPRPDWTVLHAAAVGDDPAVVRLLLDVGADPNARRRDGGTPLHLATKRNSDSAVVAALLTVGADPNARDGNAWTPLHMAAAHGDDPAVVAALLAAGGDPERRATGTGDLRRFDDNPAVALTMDRLDRRETYRDSWTALHVAAAVGGGPAVVRILLAAGADPMALDEYRRIPFDLALGNAALAGTDVLRLLDPAGR